MKNWIEGYYCGPDEINSEVFEKFKYSPASMQFKGVFHDGRKPMIFTTEGLYDFSGDKDVDVGLMQSNITIKQFNKALEIAELVAGKDLFDIKINPEYMDHIVKGGPFNHRETIFMCVFFGLAFIYIMLVKFGVI